MTAARIHGTARSTPDTRALLPMPEHDARYPHSRVMPRHAFQDWKDRK